LQTDDAVAVGVDPLKFLLAAQPLAPGDFAVAVAIHPLEPQWSFGCLSPHGLRSGHRNDRTLGKLQRTVGWTLAQTNVKLVWNFGARDLAVAVSVPRRQSGPGQL